MTSACSGGGGGQQGGGKTVEGGMPEVLATATMFRVTLAEANERAAAELEQLETAYRQRRHAILESTARQLVREQVFEAEATRRGITTDSLLAAAAPVAPATDEEVVQWYSVNQARIGSPVLDASLQAQIRDHLGNERRETALRSLQERLEQEHRVVLRLEPFRFAFDHGDAPTAGGTRAAVELVEFSDFECPYCRTFTATLKQVLGAYGDRVRLVYRQMPIPSLHPQAFRAAEASLCAHEQGRFWDFHDALFADQASNTDPRLSHLAARLQLDTAAFDECLASGRRADQVRADMREGTRVGVNGTPALFVNGRPLPAGALPYETVAEAIDAELARRR
jgi:predicted DsbA family dithiol-disulfide isomerase